MGKWIEQYGEFLLTGIAALLITILILTTGMLSAIGERGKMEENSYTGYEDFKVFSELCRRKKPEITCNTERKWHVGEVISIEEAFAGEDADGRNLRIEVESVMDRKGDSYLEAYDKETHHIVFAEAGIYRFTLKVRDGENLCVTRQIELSVDNSRVNG